MTWNANMTNANERERGRVAEFANEIIDVLLAMGMSDRGCGIEGFISPSEEDHAIDIMTLHCVTNAKATLTLSLLFGKWKKC